MESTLAELTEQLRQTPTMKAYNQEDASDPCAAGSGVLAFFEEQFSRAIVIKAPSQTPDGNPLLWFADYGNTSSTPLDDVRPLPAQFADLPSRVVPCALANVRPKNGALVWPTDVQLMLKQLLLKDLKIIVKDIQKDFFPRHKVWTGLFCLVISSDDFFHPATKTWCFLHCPTPLPPTIASSLKLVFFSLSSVFFSLSSVFF